MAVRKALQAYLLYFIYIYDITAGLIVKHLNRHLLNEPIPGPFRLSFPASRG